VGNANSVESVTIRNLQASVERLQKCATATIPELAAARKQAEEARKQAEEARKQAEEGASRLNALEAQMSRVFPPAANKGRGKGKSGANVLLETRVSDLEKAGAINTNTAKSKAKEVTSIASALSKATTEIAKLKNQLEASVAAPAAEHVQDVALQEAVDSNTTRIAVTEAAIQTLASFKTQLVDLQQKVSTIEVSMSPAAPESNYSHLTTAPKRQRTKRVETRGSKGGDAGTSGESTPTRTPRKKSRSKKSSRHRSRTRSRTRSRSRSSARGRSTETSPRKTTPSKRYDVCMTCV
jgi:DNA repair exonuclease SbcCD ATPase subunit